MNKPCLVTCCAIVLSTVACKKTIIINVDTVKDRLRENFATWGTIDEVTCPSSVKTQKGLTFECAIAFKEGGSMRIALEQTDDRGHVSFKLVGKMVSASVAAKQIADGLKEQAHVDVTIDCGKGVQPTEADGTFKCHATFPAGKQEVVLMKVDDDGQFTWNIPRPSSSPPPVGAQPAGEPAGPPAADQPAPAHP